MRPIVSCDTTVAGRAVALRDRYCPAELWVIETPVGRLRPTATTSRMTISRLLPILLRALSPIFVPVVSSSSLAPVTARSSATFLRALVRN